MRQRRLDDRNSYFGENDILTALPLLQMGPWLQMVASPYLIVTLLLWSSLPGLWGQEFQFGPCRVEGVALPRLLEAFRTVKETMQIQDNITSVRLLQREVLQDVSDAESCYLVHDLLKFYLSTVFKNYSHKIAEFKMLPSFSTLANNFLFIVSKLQLSMSRLKPGPGAGETKNETLSVSDSAHRRFLLFKSTFKQLEMETALSKAFGEVDILLTWMGKFYRL
ncbi:interleukin-24 isoform X2 [Cavia porcellus]|uniref:interleukin-24 isoform X2 n=1 Tax=Cavia porcellus TaxID=10141 RepID=UPI002FE162C5